MTTLTAAVGPVTRADGTASEKVAVPWPTVLTFAVALAYTDGFWLMSLRGAVGAIERTQTPLLSWMRESTLVLPLFAVAVLAAVTLAMRWFGPQVSTPRRVIGTGLLLVAAATVAAVGQLLVSSAYDYHLQSQQVAMMGSMGTVCVGPCLAKSEHATLVLQIRAVGIGSLILLASNLVVVGWLVAVRAGRLTLGSTKQPSSSPTSRGARSAVSRTDDLRTLLAAALLAAGVVHAAVVPEHLHEWPAAGVFFVLLTAAELGIAIQVLGRLRRSVLVAAALVSVGPLVLWLYSRTLGMPFGPEPGVPEAVGLSDIAACLLELGALVAVCVLARGRGRLQRPAASPHVRGIALLGVLAITTVGLGGTGLALFTALGETGHSMETTAATSSTPT